MKSEVHLVWRKACRYFAIPGSQSDPVPAFYLASQLTSIIREGG